MLPWWIKISSKIVLARLPVKYALWRHLQLFRHGAMVDPDYALEVFKGHFQAVGPNRLTGGFTALELGPGDSLLSALLVRAFGGGACYLIDSGDFADRTPATYQRAVQRYRDLGYDDLPPIEDLTSVETMLDLTRGRYLAEGLNSLRSLADKSVDFIWSQAVLEHVRRAEFPETLRQMRRIIREDGVCSHRIDLKDHLTGGLNNLRFSPEIWEGELFSRSGFYTNRLRRGELMQMFEEANFEPETVKIDRWDKLPLARSALHSTWADLPLEELGVSGLNVILRPK